MDSILFNNCTCFTIPHNTVHLYKCHLTPKCTYCKARTDFQGTHAHECPLAQFCKQCGRRSDDAPFNNCICNMQIGNNQPHQ